MFKVLLFGFLCVAITHQAPFQDAADRVEAKLRMLEMLRARNTLNDARDQLNNFGGQAKKEFDSARNQAKEQYNYLSQQAQQGVKEQLRSLGQQQRSVRSIRDTGKLDSLRSVRWTSGNDWQNNQNNAKINQNIVQCNGRHCNGHSISQNIQNNDQSGPSINQNIVQENGHNNRQNNRQKGGHNINQNIQNNGVHGPSISQNIVQENGHNVVQSQVKGWNGETVTQNVAN